MSTHVNPPSPTPHGGPPPIIGPFTVASPTPQGNAAFGTLVQILADSGPPEVYVNIAGIGDITGPNTSIAEAETTSHSTGTPVRSYIPTLIDPGDLTFPCYWNPTDPTQAVSSPYGLEYLFYARKVTKFQLVMPDPSHRTRQFAGFVKQISETYPMAGICTRQTAIRITTPMADVAPAINTTPTSATVTTAGAPTNTFDVKAGGAPVAWSALPDVAWITVTSPTGRTNGDASVTYAVTANTSGTPRVGHINMAELALVFTVNQS